MSDEVLGLVQAPLKHAGQVLSSWVNDPERALLGINTPAESAVWGKVLGKDYEPNVNMLGGATEAEKAQMAKDGINMGLAKPAFTVADTVAGYFGGQAASSALGNTVGTGGGTLGQGAAPAAAPAAAGGGVSAAAKTITGSAIGDTVLKAGASAAASAAVFKAMAPKPPDLPAPIEMPDPLAQEQARKKSIVEQLARRGRASTILTDSGRGSKLGG